jgi:arylsulfatase A-like enzyme
VERRAFLRRVGVALAGLSLTSQTSGGDVKPNFLVVMTDDQPYYTIPHMAVVSSKIKNLGVTFSPHAYVSTPLCSPARATLLTGKWSHNTNLTLGGYETLRDSGLQNDTIATRLQNAGYATLFGGKYINDYDGKAMPPGWDSWFAMVEPVNDPVSFSYRTGGRTKTYDRAVYNETDVLRGEVERFVRNRANSPQPWFAYVCPHAPHGPYTPAKRHANEFETKRLRGVPSVGEKNLSDKPGWCRTTPPIPTRRGERTPKGTGASSKSSRR